MEGKLTAVKGKTLAKYPNDSDGAITLDRMGNVINCDWIQARINAGYGYNFANIEPDTTITGSTSYAATDPGILVQIASGTVMVPFWVNVAMEDSSGTDNYVIIGCDTAALYVSGGGTAGSALNSLRTTGGGTSAATAYNGKTAIIMTDPTASERTLYHWADAFADGSESPPRVIVWEPKYPPVLIGPATLYVYIYGSSAPEFQYSVQWIEIPTEKFTA